MPEPAPPLEANPEAKLARYCELAEARAHTKRLIELFKSLEMHEELEVARDLDSCVTLARARQLNEVIPRDGEA